MLLYLYKILILLRIHRFFLGVAQVAGIRPILKSGFIMRKNLIFIFLALIPTSIFGQDMEWDWVKPWPQGNLLNEVHAVGENHFVAVGGYGTIITTFDGGETWKINGFGHHQTQFRNVVFPTAETGFALGSTWLTFPWGYAGILVSTQDGGLT